MKVRINCQICKKLIWVPVNKKTNKPKGIDCQACRNLMNTIKCKVLNKKRKERKEGKSKSGEPVKELNIKAEVEKLIIKQKEALNRTKSNNTNRKKERILNGFNTRKRRF